MNAPTPSCYHITEMFMTPVNEDDRACICPFDTVQTQQAQRLMQIGTMAASVAHDLSNLLTVIEGSAALVAESLPPGHTNQHDLAVINQASRRSSALIRQLLSFVRQQPPNPFPIHIGDTLTSIGLLIDRIAGRTITLIRDIAPDLWMVSATHSQIEQILINLLTNARDAMPGGGQITISARNDTDSSGARYVLLEVADSGPGMPPEVLSHLFSPFYTTKAPGKGTGLGLTICATVIAQLGGRIDIESSPGHGTTARVLLPKVG
ncbi:MAG: hypothetical protein HGA65_09465 [Oscillochloris sp.]|nr:hypothetical protein [Oscillochloris sp.]